MHHRAASNINFDAHVSRHDRQRPGSTYTNYQVTTETRGAYELANLESQPSICADPSRFKGTEVFDSQVSMPNVTTQSTIPSHGLQRKRFGKRIPS